MNFFGHAVAASWVDARAVFAFGAMLPDFSTMIGARLHAINEDVVGAGVDWHHETDAAFHRHEIFRRHAAALTDSLARRGIGRGGSLAAGHVGVELLLDGLLLEGPQADAAYLAALACGGGVLEAVELVERANVSERGEPRARLAELVSFLARRGTPDGYRDPNIVADRVLRVLANRPRLVIEARDKGTVAEALAEAKRALSLDAARLTRELRAELVGRHGAALGGGSPRAPSSR